MDEQERVEMYLDLWLTEKISLLDLDWISCAHKDISQRESARKALVVVDNLNRVET